MDGLVRILVLSSTLFNSDPLNGYPMSSTYFPAIGLLMCLVRVCRLDKDDRCDHLLSLFQR